MTKQTTTTTATLRSRACTLAYELAQNNDMTSSEAMTWAWYLVKKYRHARVLTFAKKDGSIARRLVGRWIEYNEAPKGTGRPLKDGQQIFTDLDKYETGLAYTTISTYQIIKSV